MAEIFNFLEDEPEVQSNPQPQEESWLGYGARTAGRTAARAGEAVAGLPGNIASGVNELAKVALPSYNEIVQREAANPQQYRPYDPSKLIPTSENLRKNITQNLTGQYLEPQGTGEAFYDEIIGDAATLLLPLKGKVPFKNAALSALGRSAVGNVSKWASEEITGSPLVGAAAKIGSIALASTYGGRQHLEGLKNTSYEDAFSKIPKKEKFNFWYDKKKIQNAFRKAIKGDHPDKPFFIDRLKAIDDLHHNVHPEEIIRMKQGWNAHLRDSNISKQGKVILGDAVEDMNSVIGRYGAKNPAFYEPYQLGEELTGALNSSNAVQELFDKSPYLQKEVTNPLVKMLLFGSRGLKELIKLPIIAAKASARPIQLLWRSPEARKYYTDVIKAATKNDKKALAGMLPKLDKAANEAMEKYPDLAEEQPQKQQEEFIFLD